MIDKPVVNGPILRLQSLCEFGLRREARSRRALEGLAGKEIKKQDKVLLRWQMEGKVAVEEGYALHRAEDGPAPPVALPVRLADLPRALRRPLNADLRLSLAFNGSIKALEGGGASIGRAISVSAAGDPAVERLVQFLDASLGSDFDGFAGELLASDGDPQEIARLLLEPAARWIGEAWCDDDWDFARVTFAASRLQRLFWRLAAQHPPRPGRTPAKLALLTPAPGEQHTFGLSVVEDALRRAGWEVDCCRFGEESEMFRLVSRNHYCFVGISLSGEALLPACASAIGRLRSRSRNPSITVVAGGSLFLQRPELATAAGADMIAGDARSVPRMAEGIFAAAGARHPACVAAE